MADENTNGVKNEEPVKPVVQKVDQPQVAPVAPVNEVAKKVATKGVNKTLVIAVVVALLIGGGWYYKKSSDKSKSEKAAETFIESLTGNNFDIDASSNSIKYTDEDSGETTTFESGQKLPSDFPKDSIPYLDEESISTVVSSTNEGKKNWSVTAIVNKSLEEAVAYFTGELVEPDYTDISTYSYNNTATFSAKNTGYSVYINVSKYSSDADTTVTYIITQN